MCINYIKSRLIPLTILIFSCIGCKQGNETDKNDNVFKTIKIGGQIWMAENFKTNKFQNGDLILEAKTENEWINACNKKLPAWCFYENNPKNGEKYGKLYNYYALMDKRGLAPLNWRIPSWDDWNELTVHILVGECAASAKIKSEKGWKYGNGSNSSGFNALPAGYRNEGGKFSSIGEDAIWWTSTECDSSQRIVGWFLFSDCVDILCTGRNIYMEGYSIRCIKNK